MRRNKSFASKEEMIEYFKQKSGEKKRMLEIADRLGGEDGEFLKDVAMGCPDEDEFAINVITKKASLDDPEVADIVFGICGLQPKANGPQPKPALPKAKAYVVTSGTYSDYSIDCVFLDREKADLYVKYHAGPGWGEDYRVEEFDLSDDDLHAGKGYIRVTESFIIEPEGEGKNRVRREGKGPKVAYRYETTKPGQTLYVNVFEDYSCTGSGYDWEVHIRKFFPEDRFSEKEAKEKFEKIAQDLCAQINYHKSMGTAVDVVSAIFGDDDWYEADD